MPETSVGRSAYAALMVVGAVFEGLVEGERGRADVTCAERTAPAAGPAVTKVPEPVEMRATRLELAPYDLGAALALERGLGVSHALAQVLVRRGYRDLELARAFMVGADRHDPGEFDGIDGVVARIEDHIERGGRVVVHGDYDVDGVCATAVLVRALRSRGADAHWYVPSRSEDGYGLASATVARLCADGTALLITVDCGITAVEQVAQARAAGLEVIVTDHHAPRMDGELPACPIVHPGVSGYPFRDLCGTAVAHKLAQALGAHTTGEDLELVALATVADQMPLIGENRRIVREGLQRMAGTRRPGLRALMSVARADPSGLDARALAFRLAPRINAAGRLRRADAALELLLTDDAERAAAVARELDAVNTERRGVEERINWEAQALARELGERSAYVLAAPGWHAGVIGIVASKIVERFNRPAIMLTLDGGDPEAPAHGSGRSIPGFDLLAALDATGMHLLSYGGHRAAAGLSLAPDSIGAFRAAFEEYAGAHLTPEMLMPRHSVDAVVSAGALTLDLAEELESLAPFGNGNPEVRLEVAGARFEDVRAIGEGGRHARFSVSSGGVRARAVSFGSGRRFPGADGGAVDASFELGRNVWNGVVEPRLTLRAAQPCACGEVRVLGEADDYMAAVLEEMDRDVLEAMDRDPEQDAGTTADTRRTVLDRRGESALATLVDARAAAAGAGERVLVVCADSPRRLSGLSERCGGFSLISHRRLSLCPELSREFEHVVVLDPPTSSWQDTLTRSGSGYTHLAWGEAELRFAMQMHELEYGLRASLVALYRAVRGRGRAVGEELERLLRGDGSYGRSAGLAGRLVKVLTELELVSLNRDLPSLELAGAEPTELERSAAYRAFTNINEDGQRFLRRSTARAR